MSGDGEGEAARKLSVSLLEEAALCRQQNGLRHGDFGRYHGYCSRRLRRLRRGKGVGLTFGNGKPSRKGHAQAFSFRRVADEEAVEERHLLVGLFFVERAWAQFEDLKLQAADVEERGGVGAGKIRKRAKGRLRRAVGYAEELEAVCERDGDERTKVEARVVKEWMLGLLCREEGLVVQGRNAFANARRMLTHLSSTAPSPQAKQLLQERVGELQPLERFCAYEIARLVRAGVISKEEARADEAEEERMRGYLEAMLAVKEGEGSGGDGGESGGGDGGGSGGGSGGGGSGGGGVGWGKWGGVREVVRVEEEGGKKVCVGAFCGVVGRVKDAKVVKAVEGLLEAATQMEGEARVVVVENGGGRGGGGGGGGGGGVEVGREFERASGAVVGAAGDALRAMESFESRFPEDEEAKVVSSALRCLRLLLLVRQADAASLESCSDAQAAFAARPELLEPLLPGAVAPVEGGSDAQARKAISSALLDVVAHCDRTLRTLAEVREIVEEVGKKEGGEGEGKEGGAWREERWVEMRGNGLQATKHLFLALERLAGSSPANAEAAAEAGAHANRAKAKWEVVLGKGEEGRGGGDGGGGGGGGELGACVAGAKVGLAYAEALVHKCKVRWIAAKTAVRADAALSSTLTVPLLSRENPATVSEALDPAAGLTPTPFALRPLGTLAVDTTSPTRLPWHAGSIAALPSPDGLALHTSFPPEIAAPFLLAQSKSHSPPLQLHAALPSARLTSFPPAPSLVPMMAKPLAFDVAHDYVLGWIEAEAEKSDMPPTATSTTTSTPKPTTSTPKPTTSTPKPTEPEAEEGGGGEGGGVLGWFGLG